MSVGVCDCICSTFRRSLRVLLRFSKVSGVNCPRLDRGLGRVLPVFILFVDFLILQLPMVVLLPFWRFRLSSSIGCSGV